MDFGYHYIKSVNYICSMKKIIHNISCFILVLCFAVSSVIAQNTAEWEPVKLNVAGSNSVKGVAAVFQKVSCDGESYVLVKFTNNNPHSVTIKWYDALLTQQEAWIKKDDLPKKELAIGPGKNAIGECGAGKDNLCTIKLKDYLPQTSDYKSYAIYHFEVIDNK